MSKKNWLRLLTGTDWRWKGEVELRPRQQEMKNRLSQAKRELSKELSPGTTPAEWEPWGSSLWVETNRLPPTGTNPEKSIGPYWTWVRIWRDKQINLQLSLVANRSTWGALTLWQIRLKDSLSRVHSDDRGLSLEKASALTFWTHAGWNGERAIWRRWRRVRIEIV